MDDHEAGTTYIGTNVVTQPDAATAEVTTEFGADYFGPGTLLTATGASGIVAIDDGGDVGRRQ